MAGLRASQILWIGETTDAASFSQFAAPELTIAVQDCLGTALAYLAAGHRVDGILLDLVAPEPPALATLAALATLVTVPVIVLVGPTQTALGLEAVEAGAEDYLVTGQTAAEIERVVGSALARHRRRQLNFPTHPRGGNTGPDSQDQRYLTIFQGVPVSLWEEDWSAVIALVSALRRQGVTDFATYIEQHPEFVTQAMQRVHILDVNQATLDIFKAQTKADIVSSLEAVFSTPDTLPGFRAELMAFCLGKPVFETEMALRTLTGDLIHAWVKITFPDAQSGSARVLVSLIDITERVQLEAQRQQAEALLATRIRQQEAVARLGLAATGADRLEPLLQEATEQVAAVLGMEFCTVLKLTQGGSDLQLVAGVGWHPDRLETITIRLDQAFQSQVTLDSQHPIYVDDLRQETRFSPTPLLIDYQIASSMSMAIRVQGKPWGVLGAHSRHPRRFSPDDTHFVQSVAALLALAIERVATQAALEKSHHQMQTAQRIAALGSWEYDIVNDRLHWSEACYRAAEIPCDRVMLTCADFLQYVHPDDLALVVQQFEQAIEQRTCLDYEHRWLGPDGQVRYLHQRGEIAYDPSGTPVRMVGTLQNVTAQAQAEANLRASEERFRLVSRATNDAIWDWDILNDTTWRGEGYKTLFGYSDADMQIANDWWRSRVHPDDRPRLFSSIQVALAGEATSWTDEYRFCRRDERYAYVMDRGYIIRDAQGQAVRMIGGMLDLTEKKDLEARLLQSQKMEAIGQLTGGVAHDFNNLLTVILGNAELLVEQLDRQPQMRSLATMISDAAQRGANLTQRLLVFARRQTLDPKPVDVNRLIARMDGLLRRTLGEQIEVRCSYGAPLWPALVDASQLENALLNLCINARDAMGEKGCLTLSTAPVHIPLGAHTSSGESHLSQVSPREIPPGEYVVVTVADTGVGMAADLLSQVFEPFFTTKAKGKGTGLGLSMVYGFVRQSNGCVKIDSEPGVGTTVRLYLPRCGAGQRSGEPAPLSTENVCSGGSELILLVEDNALVRDYAQQQLESLGYRVLAAENGPTALAMLQQQPEIDLLFTDVIMPGGLNGRELADAARRLRPGLRVLYTSGYAENVLSHQAGPEAELQLLHKPYQRVELACKIRQAFARG
ncbi:PAS domain-containing protein [Nodosilinea sp. PGN35]|uniref:PAS domain-containing protein n=1 Tax=Nodosilinea sp. PGN35 TaxID=3020489 RepID=UPI0023B293B7|nr:PAS domain-containing protein [Nodosilinea sp. TSF1-S3]MDF0369477.1 PAS domain-containing protein [Nodosilinea sp. TSF1-S3]